MPSLSVHLRLPDDHSRLPFHPSCPVCRRDRLAGVLTGDELVSRRTQATIAAGLLAFSGVGAPTAMAADPDTVSEGTAEVVDDAGPDSFDIGEDTIQMPSEASATPEVADPPADVAEPPADDEDIALIVEELESDAVEPVVEATDDLAAPSAEAPPTVVADPVTPPAEAPPVSTATEGPGIRAEGSKRLRVARERPTETATDSEPAVIVSTEPPAPVVAPTATATGPTRVATGADTGRAAQGARLHTVRPGDSLWSIASDLLGDRASVGRVAREVNRLWELNEDRIATGSPDLLYAGTRLRLR